MGRNSRSRHPRGLADVAHAEVTTPRCDPEGWAPIHTSAPNDGIHSVGRFIPDDRKGQAHAQRQSSGRRRRRHSVRPRRPTRRPRRRRLRSARLAGGADPTPKAPNPPGGFTTSDERMRQGQAYQREAADARQVRPESCAHPAPGEGAAMDDPAAKDRFVARRDSRRAWTRDTAQEFLGRAVGRDRGGRLRRAVGSLLGQCLHGLGDKVPVGDLHGPVRT